MQSTVIASPETGRSEDGELRADLQIIAGWIHNQSRVLDLGCGDGRLLDYLARHKGVRGYGLEIDPENINACLSRGVNVLEHDLDRKGLQGFRDQQFDMVVMTQALQAVRHPDQVLTEMLRVAREGVVTFPNFAYWRLRSYLMLRGRMPVSRTLPYNWYDTPNIHLCTFSDFETLCHEREIRIVKRSVVDNAHQPSRLARWFPNAFGQIAIYHIARQVGVDSGGSICN